MSRLRNRYQESKITVKRLSLVAFCFLVLYFILFARLYHLQVRQYDHYQRLSERNKNKEVYIAPYRADILDRNGKPLATYDTKLILHLDPEAPQDTKVLLESKGIRLTDKSQYTLTQGQYAYLSNYTPQGVVLESVPYRYYPLGPAAAHLIGHVGRMDKPDYTFLETPQAGKSGLEKQYESELFGQPGLQRQHKNAKGQVFNSKTLREPKRSAPLRLTLDADLQSYAHDLMLGHVGSLIVLNPNNGEILAAVSSPSYDPNLLGKSDYQQRLALSDKPMFNRITQALYPPGSIVKPFIALGAMGDQKLDPNALIEDPGHFKLNENSRVFHDHKRTGHGKVDLHRAIAVSCDTYFYHLAQHLGIDRIVKYLEIYKFGEKTEVEMAGEVFGILPTKAYRDKHYKRWYQGQTIITGIGQGDILVSPIQLARATMLLANSGYDYPLTFIQRSEREPPQQIPVNPSHRAYIVRAMEDVVKTGTGRRIRQKPYTLAAKTSTVQVVELQDPSKYHALPDHQKDHHMVMSFSPSESPNLVVLVVIEHQHEAVSILEKVLDWCYEKGYINADDLI